MIYKLTLLSPFLIIHLLLFLFSKERNNIIYDIERNIFQRGISLGVFYGLIYLLVFDRYFRQLFYYRIGKVSKFLKLFLPGERTFIIGTKIMGGGIYVAHPYATIINAKSIGSHFTCHQCVTIGNKLDGRNDLVPTIGDNVCVSANVVIIGDIKIGNNVVIGAGSVVITDIPDNCIVAGNPARLIREI